MSTNILFVFEGPKTEGQIVKSLEEHILNEKTIIKCAYASDIYQLYREIEKDNDLDVFYLIKKTQYSKNIIVMISPKYIFFLTMTHMLLWQVLKIKMVFL